MFCLEDLGGPGLTWSNLWKYKLAKPNPEEIFISNTTSHSAPATQHYQVNDGEHQLTSSQARQSGQ